MSPPVGWIFHTRISFLTPAPAYSGGRGWGTPGPIDLDILDQTFPYIQEALREWKSYSQFGYLLVELLI